ncbi:hypothetical protein ACQCU1_18865 [Sutcliffiella horikoshii]|uniref:hypothetical protein n=1 Tax=Sutcliffiella horikoshii TaxID=79883 RepID=UPI003CEAB20B
MITLGPISKEISKKDVIDNIDISINDFAFVSGSLIEGQGNDKSDLDVFVVVQDIRKLADKSNIAYNQEHIKTAFTKINGIGCDIEYWSEPIVKRLLENINEINFADTTIRSFNQLDIENISLNDLTSFIHRFITSQSIYNDELYELYKKDINKTNYFKLLVRMNVNIIDNSLEDVIGNYNKGEYETALIIIKNILIKALCIYLYSNEISLDREKWAYIKLKTLSETDMEAKRILSEFKNIYFYSNVREQEFNSLCEMGITFVNKLIRIAGKKLGGY